jgi:hypothetical protein
MADVLFQFCHDIICIDVSKTLIPSCFYFQVFEHKEAKSGKSCYVRVTSGLLVAYRDRARKPLGGNLWLFLTRTGKFIGDRLV